jgi:hypothetical protein
MVIDCIFTGLFSDRTLTDRTPGQTVVVARCDIPRAPMLKHPIKRHLKKGVLRTDRSPTHHTEWKRDFRPHTAPLSSPPPRPLVLPRPSTPPLAPAIAAAIAAPPLPPPSPRRRHCRRPRRAAIATLPPSPPSSPPPSPPWGRHCLIVS